MRAFFINTDAQTIEQIDIDPARFLSTLYERLDCSLVEIVAGEPVPGHDIWIDEEGMLYDRPPHGLLAIPDTHQKIFAGRAIVTGGPDDEGDTTAATCSADDICARVYGVCALSEQGALVAPLRVIQADNAAA